MDADPLLSIAEELYALPPGEFTGTRNQWARQTRSEGDRALAARVTALRRPSLAAWVVNMLMRHQGDQMSQVLDLGASLRQAQADLDGDALRELTRQRRQLTTVVGQQGRALAADLGQKVTGAVGDQVQATLHAALVDATAAEAVRSGMLVSALSATGVGPVDVAETVAVPEALGFTPRPRTRAPARRPELSVVRDPDPALDPARDQAERERADRVARSRRRVEDAVASADSAQRRLRKARKRVGKVQARTLQTAEELEEVRRRVAELEHELESLDGRSATAHERVGRDEQAYAEAQDALEVARAELARQE